MRVLPVISLLATVGCAAGSSVGGIGLPVRPIRPEDRVLIGDFSHVNAIASSFDRLYVVYSTALSIYRPLQHRWEVPRAPSEPRELGGVFAAVIDGVDQSVWLATGTGWLHYRQELDQWDRGQLPGRVQDIAVDAADPTRGIWFLTSGGWYVQPRFGGAAQPATPPNTLRRATSVDDAIRDLPQLRALAPTIALGPRLSGGRLTAAAPVPDGSGWYLGTSSSGLLFFDRMGARAEPLRVGLPSEVVGAVAASGDDVWVGTDATPLVGANLTRLSSDLSTAESIRGLPTTGLPFDAARRLLVKGDTLWAGTDRGAVRVALASGRVARFGDSEGLAEQRVTSFAVRNGRVIIGTLGGLSEESATGRVERIAVNFTGAVYALATRGDTVWAGTVNGLTAHLPGRNDLSIPDGLRALGGGNLPVYGVGYLADTLVAMTADRVLWRDPVSGAWNPGPQLSTQVGRLIAMDVGDDGIWVIGPRGAALLRPTTAPLRVLQVPGDLPDQVTSIARSGDYLWIGTLRGLVRYQLEVR